MYRSKKEIAFAGEVEQEFGFLETNPSQLTGTPDIYFADCKLAVFYHGCFWHSHHCRDRALSEGWHRKLLDLTMSACAYLNSWLTVLWPEIIDTSATVRPFSNICEIASWRRS